jgi:copper(I)-binding protein
MSAVCPSWPASKSGVSPQLTRKDTPTATEVSNLSSARRSRGYLVRRTGAIVATAAMLAVTLWLAVAGLPDVAHAAAKTVCATGGDFTTIQAAVDSAGPGDVIQICAGTYAESVNLSTMATVGDITLQASSTPVLIRPGSGSALYITENFTGSVTLVQLDVRSPTAPGIEFDFGNWLLGDLTLDRVVANNNAANGIIANVDGAVVVTGTQASYNRYDMTVDFNYSGIYLNVTGDVEIENTETISNNGWGVYVYFTQRSALAGVAAEAADGACVGDVAFTITNLTTNENAYDGLYVSSGSIIGQPTAFASIVGAINNSTFEYNQWNGAYVKIQRDPTFLYSRGACTSQLTVDGSVAEENGYLQLVPVAVDLVAPANFLLPYSGFDLWSGNTHVSNSVAEANAYAGVLHRATEFYDTTVPATLAAVTVPLTGTDLEIVDTALLYNNIGLEATDTRLVSVTNVTVYSNAIAGITVDMNPEVIAAGGHAAVKNSWIMDNGQADPSDNGGGIIVARSWANGPVLLNAATAAPSIAAAAAPQATVSGSLVCRNEESGLEAIGVDVDAAGNWWNSYLGPTNPQNPGGDGDIVKESPFDDSVSGLISGTVDFTPWIDMTDVDFSQDPAAGVPTTIVFQFSDQAKSVFLGEGPGDRNGPAPFGVTTDNGIFEDPAGNAASVARFLSSDQGKLVVTWIPAQGNAIATLTLTGPCDRTTTFRIPVGKPDVAISKEPAFQRVQNGNQADFTIVVTNTGNTALTGVEVTDAQAPDCAQTLPDLGVGESTSYACSVTATADFVNVAEVEALPVVVSATLAGSAAQVVSPVTATASAVVDVLNPSVLITKTAGTDPFTCGAPGPLTVVPGTGVYFCFTLTNTGDVTLTNHLMSDPLLPDLDDQVLLYALTPGASFVITPTLLVPWNGPALGPVTLTESVTNTVLLTASIASVDGGPAIAYASSQERIEVLTPAVAIAKEPAYQMVPGGGQADFVITVTNTGNTDLTGVEVTDPQTASCAQTLPDLAPGATTSYTCSAPATVDFVNVAEVSAVPMMAPAVLTGSAAQAADLVTATASAVVDVVTPGLAVTKTATTDPNVCGVAGSLEIVRGTPIYFCVTVANTGDITLTNHLVSDPLLGLNDVPVQYPLAPGAALQITPFALVPFGGPALGPLTPTVSITNTVVVTASLPVPVGGPVVAAAASLVPVAVTPPTALDDEDEPNLFFPTRLYLPAIVR